jgi:hypothetical protein
VGGLTSLKPTNSTSTLATLSFHLLSAARAGGGFFVYPLELEILLFHIFPPQTARGRGTYVSFFFYAPERRQVEPSIYPLDQSFCCRIIVLSSQATGRRASSTLFTCLLEHTKTAGGCDRLFCHESGTLTFPCLSLRRFHIVGKAGLKPHMAQKP